ncbi:hypothetical protein [Kitasatospora sp. NPDC001225]
MALLGPAEHQLGGAEYCEVAGAGAGSWCFGEVGADASEIDRSAGTLTSGRWARATAERAAQRLAAEEAVEEAERTKGMVDA